MGADAPLAEDCPAGAASPLRGRGRGRRRARCGPVGASGARGVRRRERCRCRCCCGAEPAAAHAAMLPPPACGSRQGACAEPVGGVAGPGPPSRPGHRWAGARGRRAAASPRAPRAAALRSGRSRRAARKDRVEPPLRPPGRAPPPQGAPCGRGGWRRRTAGAAGDGRCRPPRRPQAPPLSALRYPRPSGTVLAWWVGVRYNDVQSTSAFPCPLIAVMLMAMSIFLKSLQY